MTSTPHPISAFIEATNAGDSDAFVAAFAVDGFVDDWGRVLRGQDGVRSWDRTDNIGKQSHFELIDIATETEPGTYLVHLKVSGNGFNGASPFRFTLRGGLIYSVQIIPG